MGNKSSKKISLRALVTERMSRAQGSLEFVLQLPVQAINKYVNTKFTYCQAWGKGWGKTSPWTKQKGQQHKMEKIFGGTNT